MIYKHRGFIIAAICFATLFLGPHPSSGLWILPWNLGIALRIWARRYIGSHTRQAELSAPTLAQGGPYAWFRHPLYLSNLLILNGGMGFWLGLGWDWFLLTLLSISFYDSLAHGEDKFLREKFGATWEQWKAMVPYAFLPARNAKLPAVKPERNWLQSVWADRWTWLWMLLVFGGMLGYRSVYGT